MPRNPITREGLITLGALAIIAVALAVLVKLLGPGFAALVIALLVVAGVINDVRTELKAFRLTIERAAHGSTQTAQILAAATESGLIELEALRKSYDEVAKVQRAFLDGRAAVQQPGGDRHVS